MVQSKKIIIVDIDGTLSDPSHRLKFIEDAKKDWDSFYEAMDKDKPVAEICDMVYTLSKENIIVISTGRPDNYKKLTEEWLHKQNIPYQQIFMRKAGDFRPDDVVKEELLREIKRYYLSHQIAYAIEDRTRVVQMYRKNGIICLQVKDGDY